METFRNPFEYKYDSVRPGSLAARKLVDRRLQEAMGRTDVITSNDIEFNEPGNSYVDFLVPGLLAMGLMGADCGESVFPQIVLLLLFSYLLFGVVIHGNWLSILLIVILGAIEFAAIGLLVATRAKTLETASGLMNLVMLPMWTLSGIFFSCERFPEVVHPIIQLLPLTPVIDALRALMMDGKSITTLFPKSPSFCFGALSHLSSL